MDIDKTIFSFDKDMPIERLLRSPLEYPTTQVNKKTHRLSRTKVLHKDVEDAKSTLIKNLAYSENPIGILSAKFTINICNTER